MTHPHANLSLLTQADPRALLGGVVAALLVSIAVAHAPPSLTVEAPPERTGSDEVFVLRLTATGVEVNGRAMQTPAFRAYVRKEFSRTERAPRNARFVLYAEPDVTVMTLKEVFSVLQAEGISSIHLNSLG